jgi:hypothetical protein
MRLGFYLVLNVSRVDARPWEETTKIKDKRCIMAYTGRRVEVADNVLDASCSLLSLSPGNER